ncbi:jg19691 [Pararge aegeria aegeria]|uniref:Jg19691 protein n=1 Tax=Pararge aegeria aegeria TaxID=348720 RepID=A0A8S4R2A1_9NEOP|nr:jg19691 [Pararge aegeria aegeria]
MADMMKQEYEKKNVNLILLAQIGGLHTPLRTLQRTLRRAGFHTMFSFSIEVGDILSAENAHSLEKLKVRAEIRLPTTKICGASNGDSI